MENQEPDFIKEEVLTKIPTGKYRLIIIIFLIAAIISLFLLKFLPRLHHIKEVRAEAARISPPPTVRTMRAVPNQNQIELVLPSFLQGIHMTPVWAMTNGYLKNFYVDIGDKVKAGQLMAEIDTPEVDAALAQARSELANNLAKLEIARITTERWGTVYQRNSEAISLQQVQERSANYQMAEADVQTAEANVKRLEAMQAYNKIYAPFDGVVTQRTIDIGTLISSGSNGNPQQLYQVAQIDVIRAFIDVPQTFYRLIKDGMKADISVEQYRHKTFTGIVDRNSNALDPIARTLLTQVNIENREGELLTGVYAQVKLLLEPDNPVFVIPIQALIIRSGPPYVALVEEGNKVRLQHVEIGLNQGVSVEIISGIKENDLIVINPTDRIKDGTVVKVASN